MGRLNVCLYGTRDAAREWQNTLSRQLEGIGFKRGKGHPAIFHHPSRDIKTLVHGDDYVSSAMPEDLDWLESEFGKAYEIKTQRTTPKGNEEVEAKVLNRVVRRNNQGYEIEADSRYAELIVDQVLETGARTLSTPGINPGNEDEEDQELERGRTS